MNNRQQKINTLIDLIKGKAPQRDDNKPLCVLWHDDDLEHADNIYLANGRKVNFQTFNKLTGWKGN